MPIDFSTLIPHQYHCFYCGKQLFELCLGGLICRCGKTFVPIKNTDGNTNLECTNSDKQIIYIWPDDTWIRSEDYEDIEQTHKSDDFATVEISAELEDEEIEEFVYNYNRK